METIDLGDSIKLIDFKNIDRDKFIDELGLRGVQARLYYPCLHKQNVFKGMGRYNDNEFPNSIAFEKNALSLPIYPGLKNKEVNYVISSIQEIVKKQLPFSIAGREKVLYRKSKFCSYSLQLQ